MVAYYYAEKSTIDMQVNLDQKKYNEADLVSFKLPLNQPYIINTDGYESLEGNMDYNGVNYQFIKKRIINDTLEIVCIPNMTRTQIDNNNEDFAKAYARLPRISIDHAVLEVSKCVSVVEADIGWQDVGTWDALSQCFTTDSAGNFVQGDALFIDAVGCTVDSDGPMVAILGVSDLVVVHAKGAILVCPKNRAQDVKLIVDRLKDVGRADLI